MGAAKPLRLKNGKEWRTRSAAQAHFRAMRERYGVGHDVTDPEDVGDLHALLEHYDQGWEPKKAGKPIEKFSIQWNGAEGRNTPCFYIHYKDGTQDDFSADKAVKHDPSK
ncbi:DUF3223 domain-containing protein [Bordetella avium]|uniref:DUF3223 domain-containing protein n=1 Tax=Bordetella avium TaxID=521 RepID=UPI0016036507|nr:DUF3223 domain-containing protein [Bordetella avium]